MYIATARFSTFLCITCSYSSCADFPRPSRSSPELPGAPRSFLELLSALRSRQEPPGEPWSGISIFV